MKPDYKKIITSHAATLDDFAGRRAAKVGEFYGRNDAGHYAFTAAAKADADTAARAILAALRLDILPACYQLADRDKAITFGAPSDGEAYVADLRRAYVALWLDLTGRAVTVAAQSATLCAGDPLNYVELATWGPAVASVTIAAGAHRLAIRYAEVYAQADGAAKDAATAQNQEDEKPAAEFYGAETPPADRRVIDLITAADGNPNYRPYAEAFKALKDNALDVIHEDLRRPSRRPALF